MQVKVGFKNLVLGKVLNPVVFDIGQLYLIGTAKSYESDGYCLYVNIYSDLLFHSSLWFL